MFKKNGAYLSLTRNYLEILTFLNSHSGDSVKIRRQTDKNWEQKDKKKQRYFDPEGSKSVYICVQPASTTQI